MKRLVLLATLALLTGAAHAQPIPDANSPRSVRVIDGDTIYYGKVRIRLRGVDAPESYHKLAKCPEEQAAGLKAKARLFELLSPPHRVSVLWGRGKDMYGRNLGNVYSDRADVGKTLIAEGLAKPWDGQSARPSHCP